MERRASERVSTSGRSASSATPSTPLTAFATSRGSGSPASSTSHTPSAYSGMQLRAISSASRVLPQPPVPVRESSRVVARRRPTSATSRSRPMKLVNGAGRLCRELVPVWSAGVPWCCDPLGGNSPDRISRYRRSLAAAGSASSSRRRASLSCPYCLSAWWRWPVSAYRRMSSVCASSCERSPSTTRRSASIAGRSSCRASCRRARFSSSDRYISRTCSRRLAAQSS